MTQHRTSQLNLPFNLSKLAAAIGVSALLLTGCGGSDQASSADIEKHLQSAERYLSQGQFNAAMIETRNIIQKAPDSTEGKLLLAKIYIELGQIQSATEELLSIDPKNAEALLTLSESYHLQSKHQSNRELLDSHQNSLVNDDKAGFLLASAKNYLATKDYEPASEQYKELLALEPGNADAKIGLAQLAAIGLDYDRAETLLNEVLASDDNNTDALWLFAKLAMTENKLSIAEDKLTEALASLPPTDVMTPERVRILTALSEILTQQGRSAEALIYTRLLSEASPLQAEVQTLFEQAKTYLKEGKNAEAEAELKLILEKAPGHKIARQILGIMKYHQGSIEEAQNYLAQDFDPETAPDVATAAFALSNMRLNKPEQVMDALAPLINSSKEPQTLTLYGMAALSANQPIEAQRALQRALDIDPSLHRVRIALASSYNQSTPANHNQALKEIKQAFADHPNDPIALQELLRQYLLMDQQTESDKLASQMLNSSDSSAQLVVIGNYYLFKNDVNTAIKAFERASAKTPAVATASVNLGKIAMQQQRFDAAEKHFLAVIENYPNVREGYTGLISAYELRQAGAQGIARVEEIANTSGNMTAQLIVAEYYARNRNFPRANAALETLEDNHKDNPQVQSLRAGVTLAEAQTLYANGEKKQARTKVIEGLRTAPGNLPLLAMLTNIEIREDNHREASKLIEQVRDISPSLAEHASGDLALAQDRKTQALSHFEQSWNLQPNDLLGRKIYSLQAEPDKTAFLKTWLNKLPNSSYALLAAGNQALSLKSFASAIDFYERLLRQEQQVIPIPVVLNNLAWLHQQNNNNESALRYGAQAYKLAPESAAVADTYGWVLVNTGAKEEGIAILEKAAALDPDATEIKEHLERAKSL
jgi:putative PEP-CTERM system TPR-repeat lipoprotein